MIERFRAFRVVVEEGSVNRAAVRLHLSQPALSRQMQALEAEAGGTLLEREPSGVRPTALGHALLRAMEPVLGAYDAALEEVRRQARGVRSELRVGYLVSAAPTLLAPTLARWRETHPDFTLRLHDLSPKEQIEGLRAGELDVALIGQEGATAAREFHRLKLRSLRTCAALSASDPLASRPEVALRDLRGHGFIGIDESEMPGRNRWMTSLCRAAGFKPRFVAAPDGISNVLSQVVSESAVTLLPAYFLGATAPGVTFVPVSDPDARWDLLVLWQRGKTPPSTRLFLELLQSVSATLP
jgi:DNA-binding transcriptional LysR family regulator